MAVVSKSKPGAGWIVGSNRGRVAPAEGPATGPEHELECG